MNWWVYVCVVFVSREDGWWVHVCVVLVSREDGLVGVCVCCIGI